MRGGVLDVGSFGTVHVIGGYPRLRVGSSRRPLGRAGHHFQTLTPRCH
eukprot:XP_001704662.1 Hypothetical protein GL50803_124827 [Giardia lamblia ATCC 50803]